MEDRCESVHLSGGDGRVGDSLVDVMVVQIQVVIAATMSTVDVLWRYECGSSADSSGKQQIMVVCAVASEEYA